MTPTINKLARLLTAMTTIAISGFSLAARDFPARSASCSMETSGDACYNCISRTCLPLDGGGPNGGYGGDPDLTQCINDGLDACDDKFGVPGKPLGGAGAGKPGTGAGTEIAPAHQGVKGVTAANRKKFLDSLKARAKKKPAGNAVTK